MSNLQSFIESLVDSTGASYSLTTGKPTTGVFASQAKSEHIVNLSPVYNRYKRDLKVDVITAEVNAFIENNRKDLMNNGAHIGGWWENGKLVLDVSYQFDSIEEAAFYGMLNNQRAIYIVHLDRVIELPNPQQAGTYAQKSAYARTVAQELAKVN
jgi:hypothetical protein